MRVDLCGVRGSMAAAGAEFARYGGHTSCVALTPDGGEAPTLVLDAGTGLRRMTALLDRRPFRGSVLLGHLHWDHVQGMPFFQPGFAPGARVDVHVPAQGEPAEQSLARMMSPPSFPIVPSQLGAGWSFRTVEEGTFELEGFTVTAREIPHKGGRTFGYRVEDGSASLAYLSDHDPLVLGPGADGLGALHDAALALADGVDLLVHDAHITADELPALGFLGHACAEYAIALGRASGARRTLLFHHAYERTDNDLDALAATWTQGADGVRLAREGDVLVLGAAATVTTA